MRFHPSLLDLRDGRPQDNFYFKSHFFIFFFIFKSSSGNFQVTDQIIAGIPNHREHI